MGKKRFRLALADCQQAASLQSASPSSKTLVRLARCQLALGEAAPALSIIRQVLELEPQNAAAKQLKIKALGLEGHLRSFEGAKKGKDWAMARLALERCMQAIDGENGEVPTEWRCWKIELEVARKGWDAANAAAG